MSQLPPRVRELVLERGALVPFPRLKLAAERLSETYRGGNTTAATGLKPEERTAAYLAVRMPATYAAALEVFRQCSPLLASATSLVDLGAGTGAATIAAQQTMPLLETCTLIEGDPAMANAGRQLVAEGVWRNVQLQDVSVPAADVVVVSYALNELADPVRDSVVAKAWEAARIAVVFIEPGSKVGFAITRAIRDRYASFVVAPCPAPQLPCPMPAGDWCHFAARVERTSLHRQLKDGALSYEDEKFSYVVLAKRGTPLARSRVIGRPACTPGLVQLDLCSGGSIQQLKVTKRDKNAFRLARKSSWGNAWHQG